MQIKSKNWEDENEQNETSVYVVRETAAAYKKALNDAIEQVKALKEADYTAASGTGTVQLVKPVKKTLKFVTMKPMVKFTFGDFTFKATSIAKNAFKKNQKLKEVTIGKNFRRSEHIFKY